MVQLQLLNKILATKDTSILTDNGITKDYFTEYPDEYDFIINHIQEYKQVPDIETFASKFEDFSILEVSESNDYLVNTIQEEYLYSKSVPVIKKAAELLKSDANEASRYLQTELVNLTPNYRTPAVDIIHSNSRFVTFKEKMQNKDEWFIPTGFPELDDIVGGWQQGEEYIVIVARTGNGKSWVAVKMMQHAWKMGKRVGYISPEMSPDKIGYRFDTLNHNFSNRALIRGDANNVDATEYENYMNELSNNNNVFLVSTPADFNKQITVSKLKTYIIQNNLDIIAIDGITYMTDERYKRGDSKTISLTNISEDLMSLSCELKIPILVVVQSNRGGVKDGDNDTPGLEDIRDSDGISHNATKVFSLKQKGDDGLIIEIKKHRDGQFGGKLTYLWDIDKGEFTWLASGDDEASDDKKEERKTDMEAEFKTTGKVVF